MKKMEMCIMTNANNVKEAGKLTEQELAEFNTLRQTASQLVQQLGALEMRKSKLIAEVTLQETDPVEEQDNKNFDDEFKRIEQEQKLKEKEQVRNLTRWH